MLLSQMHSVKTTGCLQMCPGAPLQLPTRINRQQQEQCYDIAEKNPLSPAATSQSSAIVELAPENLTRYSCSAQTPPSPPRAPQDLLFRIPEPFRAQYWGTWGALGSTVAVDWELLRPKLTVPWCSAELPIWHAGLYQQKHVAVTLTGPDTMLFHEELSPTDHKRHCPKPWLTHRDPLGYKPYAARRVAAERHSEPPRFLNSTRFDLAQTPRF